MDTKNLIYYNLVSELDLRIIDFLNQQNSLTEAEKKVYTLYFSFLRDGSIRLPLTETLSHRFEEKFSKIKASKMQENEDGSYSLSEEDSQLAAEIEDYFSDLDTAVREIKTKEPMIVIDGYLYTQKAYAAAESIKSRFKAIFANDTAIDQPQDAELQAIIAKYQAPNFILDPLQAKAIYLGLKTNIIITGGPGTGKTTVVKFLLDELKSQPKYSSSKVYLAAPSGKASDRLRESIQGSSTSLPSDYDAMTIHRLLAYNPSTNNFAYDADNQFDKNTIFVIDEASMIDLELFAKLLEAIPTTSRVFLLGDKDQLPSVDAGAVLGDLLVAAPSQLVIELEKSQRFNSTTDVGKLALAMQKDQMPQIQEIISPEKWQDHSKLSTALAQSPSSETALQLFNYPQNTGHRLSRAKKQEFLETALNPWISRFCKNGTGCEARILCAEHKGVFGTDNINQTISKLVSGHKTDENFEGKQVMIVKNMEILRLYNGDSGIIAKNPQGELCFKKNDQDFTPLKLIPTDCITTAYASTIHKAQGSGYDYVLMFLPESKTSLLATRQILYTGITRVKKGALTIVGSKDRFDACYANIIKRDTGIAP